MHERIETSTISYIISPKKYKDINIYEHAQLSMEFKIDGNKPNLKSGLDGSNLLS
jgi:hypothetical protein